jgi:hypothetical protein
MGFAYIQWLWMTLKEEEVSVGTLNSAFSALHSILFVFNREMRRNIKVGTLIALTAWYDRALNALAMFRNSSSSQVHANPISIHTCNTFRQSYNQTNTQNSTSASLGHSKRDLCKLLRVLGTCKRTKQYW